MSSPRPHRALAEGTPLSPEERQHVDGCPQYQAAVERHRRYLGELRAQAAGAPEPDPGFSARVVARLPPEPDALDLVAWAARRSLPAAAALVFILALWTALLPPQAGSVVLPLAADDVALISLLQDAAREAP